GQNEAQKRIIDGDDVINQCQAPFNSVVNFIRVRGTTITELCTGTLLTQDIVVTSGSCVEAMNDNDLPTYFAVLGDKYYKQFDVGQPNNFPEQRISIAAVKLHPDHDATTDNENMANNIAIVKLASSAVLDEFCVQPMTRYDSFTDTSCRPFSETCRIYADVELTTNINVARFILAQNYSGETLVDGITMIATRLTDTFVGTCRYDFGSMVACLDDDGNYVLRGILSNHDKCGRAPPLTMIGQSLVDPGRPMYVVDVEMYKGWIDGCIANFNACAGSSPPADTKK
ncbi:hypothetical protein BaRGS_00003148, partial [Batillaria attramentaria]